MKRGLEPAIYNVPTPPISLSNATYPSPSASEASGMIPHASFPFPGHNTGANMHRQTAVSSRLAHDNRNKPICQRQCIFSMPSEDLNKETLYNARSFNAEYQDKALTADELKKVVDELLFQGTAISNTLLVDMDMKKSVARFPWNTGGPMVDVFVSGRVQLLDSWPDAKASDRLYWILKPEIRIPENGPDPDYVQRRRPPENFDEKGAREDAGNRAGPLETPVVYKLQLMPVTRALNDPSISDLVAVPGKPWIRGKFFCVGTITDPKSVSGPDLSSNTYDPEATMQQELTVRDRTVMISRRVYLR